MPVPLVVRPLTVRAILAVVADPPAGEAPHAPGAPPGGHRTMIELTPARLAEHDDRVVLQQRFDAGRVLAAGAQRSRR